MKLILASEAMEACARVLDNETVEFGAPRHSTWEAEQALAIYTAAALIDAQPRSANEGVEPPDYRVPVPHWLAERALA